jgi:ribosome-associated protein
VPLPIDATLTLPDEELSWTASRAGGPGGQNVNKVSTRVTVLFDVGASPSLSDRQRARIQDRLRTRIGRDGVLRVVSQRHRTQPQNREAAFARLAELLREALAEDPPRFATRPTKSSRDRRRSDKERRAALKRRRGGPVELD